MNQDPIIKTIIDLLDKQGKTQKNLTDYLGITQNAFTDWKSGRIKSYRKHLAKIAEFLNVSVDYLLGKDQSPSPRPSENTVTLFGRDGSKTDRTLTEEQYKLFLGLLDQMPDDNKK